MLESSHRILGCLEDMCTVFGDDREAVIARELSKHFETIRRESLGVLCKWIADDENQQKGEFVVLVAGAGDTDFREDEVGRVLRLLLDKLPVREAAEVAAGILGERKNRLYKRALDIKAG